MSPSVHSVSDLSGFRIELPPPLLAVLQALRRVPGARPRLVGGCVRDALLGLAAKDFDVEVCGVDFATLHRALSPFGATDVVGRSFGVIKLRLDGEEYDFSLPRRESKTGAGHRGFSVKLEPEPGLTDAEAAARRDFTINAIAWDPFADAGGGGGGGEGGNGLIDPHGGVRDLRAGVLRHTSAAFVEDPLRVLRAFQFAGRFDLTLAPETAALCRAISTTFTELPKERVWGEWQKWAEKSPKPARGLAVLEESGWLVHFPEIAALRGCPQEPDWHPEGDVFAHTAFCCDALAALPAWQTLPPPRRRLLMLAMLAHDFGKPATTVRAVRAGAERWTSPGHESAGVPVTEAFLTRIGAPLDHAPFITPIVANHLVHHHGGKGGGGGYSDSQIRRLARRLAPATIEDLCLIMTGDSEGRPPRKSPESLVLVNQLRTRAGELAIVDATPRPILLGRHLIAAGERPGPDFKPVLDAAYEAQLDGAFGDEAGALAWLAAHRATRDHTS
ncbi:polynucleotide adenylyltransferase [Opitutaceae bacterium TAV4]|nr:polynucleotide adenylyltransferase [Opitutaceae bacterium TAV4]RRJ99997.1 polynucleotide adenylyltransferase [Opitutaceae bacterium TAV3]